MKFFQQESIEELKKFYLANQIRNRVCIKRKKKTNFIATGKGEKNVYIE